MNAKLNEEAIFQQAVQMDSEMERRAFLKGACAGDADIYDRILALLRVHFEAEGFLETQVTPGEGKNLVEGPGTRIGRYKILQEIGEGGMGVVYMTEQTEPVTRKVALKIIKLGMDTNQVVARFEAERQALALMEHPNIAKVLDAGATDSGRPYFVMELVRGVPITEYCDKNKLSTRERLALFAPVCQAIQHAHQKGIIHRDIKPSNVMVTLHDGKAVPKVIDFGIAKATNQKLTEKTLFTNYSQMIGTPAYMSPEQAEMSGLDIDTRSDVYSLGVLLYELLTGTTPFPSKDLLSMGYGEMQRVIAETEPPKPSTRMSTMQHQDRNSIAKNRNLEASALGNAFKGDLDWIVMKSLEKDRNHRYETVNGLAADIQRHLNNEPVTAAAPTFTYQLSKFYRRNQGYTRIAAALIALLAITAIFSARQANLARADRDRAVDARKKAHEAGEEAYQARQEADLARDDTQKQLLASLIDGSAALQAAGQVGYQTNVFAALKKANTLTPNQEDKLRMRNVAIATLGDPSLIAYKETENPIPDPDQFCRYQLIDDTVALGYRDGKIAIHDLFSGKRVYRLEGGHQSPITSIIKLSRSNRYLTSDMGSKVTVWAYNDIHTQWEIERQYAITELQGPPLLVAYGDRVMILAPNSTQIALWNPQEQDSPQTIELPFKTADYASSLTRYTHQFVQRKVAISPTSSLAIFKSGEQRGAVIFDLLSKKEVGTLPLADYSRNSITFSPSGDYIALGSTFELAIYETKNWSLAQKTRHKLSDGGHEHVFVGSDSVIAYGKYKKVFWNWQINEVFRELPHFGTPRIAVDSRDLYTVSFEKESWFTRKGSDAPDLPHRLINADEVRNHGSAFSRDNKWIATNSIDGVKVWQVSDGSFQPIEQPLNYGAAEDATFSHGGEIMAVPYPGAKRIVFWDSRTWRIIHQKKLETGPLSIQFHPMSNLFAAGGKHFIQVWRYQPPTKSADAAPDLAFTELSFRELSGVVLELQLSKDQDAIAWSMDPTTEYLGTLHIARFTDPHLATILELSKVHVFNPCAFISGTRNIVTCRVEDGQERLEVWDYQKPQRVSQKEIRGVGVVGSSKGSLIAVGKSGIDLFDTISKRTVAKIPKTIADILHANWSDDQSHLALGLGNGSVQIWNIPKLRQRLNELELDWKD